MHQTAFRWVLARHSSQVPTAMPLPTFAARLWPTLPIRVTRFNPFMNIYRVFPNVKPLFELSKLPREFFVWPKPFVVILRSKISRFADFVPQPGRNVGLVGAGFHPTRDETGPPGMHAYWLFDRYFFVNFLKKCPGASGGAAQNPHPLPPNGSNSRINFPENFDNCRIFIILGKLCG